MSTPTFKAAGNIAIVWGTKNSLTGESNTLGYIIETLTVTPKNGEPVDIEDGDGFTVVQAMVQDGFNAKAQCVFDSNKSLPSPGANVTLVGPNVGGTGTKNYNCTFWSHSFTRTKKREKTIELTITHRPDLNT